MIHALLLAALIQTAPPPQAARPPRPAPIDCADAAHRAFDFWIGDWDASPTGENTVVARSVISPAASGCAIEENFHQTVGPGGIVADYRGVSFTVVDVAGSGQWRQFYVDSNGLVTAFEGGIVEGAMVLTAPGAGGALQRMTIAPQPDGSVRQSGAVSRDGGVTWSGGGYDFTYRRR